MKSLNKNIFNLILITFVILIFLGSITAVNLFNFNKNELKVTLEHPFYLNDKWIKASELKEGDLLLTPEGKKARIKKITDVNLEGLVNVYNLEDRTYNNYVANGVVVHNSEVPYYELPWGKSSRNLMTITLDNGELQKLSRENMIEKIAIDRPAPGLEKLVTENYDKTIGKLPNRPNYHQLETNIYEFSNTMGEKLPFLGSTYPEVKGENNLKALLFEYLKQSDERVPKLSELGSSGMLDCTAQALTIRESLGGEASGWKLYFDVNSEGKKRVHTFIAKEFTLDTGERYYGLVDPTELSFTGKPFIMQKGSFEKKFTAAELSKIKLD
ncbi:MAG: Hint domain-containing protein [Candidatus Pacearchaeota archaeon]|jgi:hypothetical protein